MNQLCILSGFIILFLLLLYINCIVVIRLPDDSHRGEGNVLVKINNMWLNVCISVHLLVYVNGIREHCATETSVERYVTRRMLMIVETDGL